MSSKIITAPSIPEIFAAQGEKFNIELEKPAPGRANYLEGFPPETRMMLAQGGIPPRGLDFNGILNVLSQFCYFMNSGGAAAYTWDETRDYIPGCEVLGSDNIKYRSVRANGANYEGPLNPTDPANSYRRGEASGGKAWLNLDDMNVVIAEAVGSIKIFAGNATPPAGWLFCRGQSLPRVDYEELFAVISTTFGGSGSNFNLPDFRGVFPRGFDAGRGYDEIGRPFGSFREDTQRNIVGSGMFTDDNGDDGRRLRNPTGAFYARKVGNGRCGSDDGGGKGDLTDNAFGFDASRSVGAAHTGSQVAPKNLAVNFIIKY